MNEPIELYRKEVTQRILAAKSQGGWEGLHTDFKQELGTKSRDYAKLVKHLLAFANTPRRTDAYIIYGVAEDKVKNVFEHVGIPQQGFPSKETIDQLVHEYTRLENVFVDSHFSLDDKPTPYIVVPMQYEGPHSVIRTINPGPGAINPEEIFRRYGSRSVRATARDVSRMRTDWGTWFLDGRYERNATSLSSALAKRFPKYSYLQDVGACVRLVYDSDISDEFGANNFPVLLHAYWGFDPVESAAVQRILDDSVSVLRRTIIGARFAPSTLEAAGRAMVRCVPLDELYFVNDSYAKLCRAFLSQWDQERSERHLSSIIDLDFRITAQRADTMQRHSVLTFLEEQLNQNGRSAVLVHGDFGCGKTTTAKRLVADLYEEYLRGNSNIPKVIYLNVNNMDIRARRDECIDAELARYRISREFVNDLTGQVARDEISLVFDGVDEMARPYTVVGRKQAIELLRDIANRRTALFFVRNSYYPELTDMIADFSVLADLDFKKSEKRTTVAQILGMRHEQVVEYIDSRLGTEDGGRVRSTLHKLGLESFLSDPLIVSLVCELVDEEGSTSLDAFPREGQKARFLGHLVDGLLEREQQKRQRHGGLAEDFGLFQRVLRAVAFSMICKGMPHFSGSQLQSFVFRALENVTALTTEAVDAFRTIAWIHRSEDGTLAFRHEALTLVCAAQHVNSSFEVRDVLSVADWQSNAPLADVVCQYAGDTIDSAGVLGATEMLGEDLPFNVRQLAKNVLQAAQCRKDFDSIPENQLEERILAAICRGIMTDSVGKLSIQILLKSLGEKRILQVTIVLLWFFSKNSPSGAVQAALELLRPRIKRDWNFCDELRSVKENPGTSFESMFLKDLKISAGDLMDSTQYEGVFRQIYDTSNLDSPTKQYVDRTLRSIEGEKHRLSQFRHRSRKKELVHLQKAKLAFLRAFLRHEALLHYADSPSNLWPSDAHCTDVYPRASQFSGCVESILM